MKSWNEIRKAATALTGKAAILNRETNDVER